MNARFFIHHPIREGNEEISITDKDFTHQVTRVLRMQKGDELILLDNTGFEFPGVIGSAGKDGVSLYVGKKQWNEREPRVAVTLYQGMVKKDKMEWITEKCTEVGAVSIVPVFAERSVKQGVNLARLEKIAKEAAEQSQRGRIPMVRAPMDFKDAVADAARSGATSILAHTQGVSRHLAEFLKKEGAGISRLNVFVGPEGGWSEGEAASAAQAGFHTASLGARILRAETAAVVASYVCANDLYGG